MHPQTVKLAITVPAIPPKDKPLLSEAALPQL